jgi:DNA-binding transcriptional MerR regulator
MDVRYSIGQVAKIIGVESHTVRFWTNELSQYVVPEIGAGDRRYFNKEHLEILKCVADLINNKGYTLSIVKKNGIKNSYEMGQEIGNSQTNFNSNAILKKIENIQSDVRKLISQI